MLLVGTRLNPIDSNQETRKITRTNLGTTKSDSQTQCKSYLEKARAIKLSGIRQSAKKSEKIAEKSVEDKEDKSQNRIVHRLTEPGNDSNNVPFFQEV
jgi:hypothetical protein